MTANALKPLLLTDANAIEKLLESQVILGVKKRTKTNKKQVYDRVLSLTLFEVTLRYRPFLK